LIPDILPPNEEQRKHLLNRRASKAQRTQTQSRDFQVYCCQRLRIQSIHNIGKRKLWWRLKSWRPSSWSYSLVEVTSKYPSCKNFLIHFSPQKFVISCYCRKWVAATKLNFEKYKPNLYLKQNDRVWIGKSNVPQCFKC
jgi:hypothetical protein